MVQYALQEVEALSLQQMLEFGRAALFDDSKILSSARHVQKEVADTLQRPELPKMLLCKCMYTGFKHH